MLWTLLVLSVEAVSRGAAMCEFIEKQLTEMSRSVATKPLTAKSVLDKSWSSAETRWGTCFDRA